MLDLFSIFAACSRRVDPKSTARENIQTFAGFCGQAHGIEALAGAVTSVGTLCPSVWADLRRTVSERSNIAVPEHGTFVRLRSTLNTWI